MSEIDEYSAWLSSNHRSVMDLSSGDVVMLKKGRFNSTFIDEDGLYIVHSIQRCTAFAVQGCHCINNGILIKYACEDATYGCRCACDCEYYKADGSKFADDFRYYKE